MCDDIVGRRGIIPWYVLVGRGNLIRHEAFHFCNSAGCAPELERLGLLQPQPEINASSEDEVPGVASQVRRPADVNIPR